MDCHHINNLLSEYADGMLAEPAAAEVEEHLAGCERCREAYESMLKIIDHMSRLETVPEPPDLVAKVNARMDRRFSPAGWLKRLFVPLRFKLPLEAAALAATALLIVRLWGIGGEPELNGTAVVVPIEERKAGVLQTEKIQEGEQDGRPAYGTTGQPEDRAVSLSETADEDLPVEKSPPAPEPPARKESPAAPGKVAADPLTWKDSEAPAANETLIRAVGEKTRIGKGRTELKPPAAKKSLTRGGKSESMSLADAPSAIGLLDTNRIQILVPDSLPKAADLTAIIQSLGGALVSREKAGDPAGPITVLVEIPALKYPDLIRELGRLGKIQKSTSPIPENKLGSIRVSIVILKSGS